MIELTITNKRLLCTFKRISTGNVNLTFSTTPAYVTVTTGLSSVEEVVALFDYAMGDAVCLTVRRNQPGAGQCQFYGRRITGTGNLGLTIYWMAVGT